mgnify:CR=1 FL=1
MSFNLIKRGMLIEKSSLAKGVFIEKSSLAKGMVFDGAASHTRQNLRKYPPRGWIPIS